MKARRLEGWRMFCTDQTRGMMGTGRDEIVEGRDRLLKTLESLLRSLDLYLNGYGESLNHFEQETDSIRYRIMSQVLKVVNLKEVSGLVGDNCSNLSEI